METPAPTRRAVLSGGLALGALSVLRGSAEAGEAPLFELSLAQWSLHRMLRAGELDALDFPRFAREQFDLRAVEYVSTFYPGRATDFVHLRRLADAAEAAGVRSLLIMVDGEGDLGHADEAERRRAVEAHFKWIAAAGFLGCHAIRVNAGGVGLDEGEAAVARTAASLRRLAELGADYGVSVIVENHGGLSSDGGWLASVMRAAEHPGVGTLPDFGNFRIAEGREYDRYRGVEELMPFAKAVSAKSHDFDAAGDETHTDYARMLSLVLDAGYRGHVGIEYEGSGLSEVEGVRATQRLLERVRDELAASGRWR